MSVMNLNAYDISRTKYQFHHIQIKADDVPGPNQDRFLHNAQERNIELRRPVEC